MYTDEYLKGTINEFIDTKRVTTKKEIMRNIVIYTLARVNKMFMYEGLPETIPAEMLERYLQTKGYTIIAKHDGDLFAYIAGIGGLPDEYYRPTEAIINNPAQNFNAILKIDKECVIIRNDSYIIGLLPLICKYAYLIAENEISMKMAEINLRIQSIITADTDNKKEAADKYIQGIINGEINAVIDKGLEEGIKTQQFITSGNSNNITQLIELEQFLKGSLLNELGLQANYNMKRETLNDSELSANLPSLKTLLNEMKEERQKGIDKVNEMFGTSITVKVNPIWEGVTYNESTGNDNNIPEHNDNTMDTGEVQEQDSND